MRWGEIDTFVGGARVRSLERFDFDSVLLPLNYVMMQNARYAADFETLLNLVSLVLK